MNNNIIIFIILITVIKSECFRLVPRTEIHNINKQNTLYEWRSGDGNNEKSNGSGDIITVGWFKDFFMLERRGLLYFDYNTQDSILSVDLKLHLKNPPKNPINITLYPMLESWGESNSNATNPIIGAKSLDGDATWRFPYFNSTYINPIYWKNDFYGGWYDSSFGITLLIKDDIVLNFINSDKMIRLFDTYSNHGLILIFDNKSISTNILQVHGKGSDYPPELTIKYKITFEENKITIFITTGIVLFILIVVTFSLLYLRYKRRDGYSSLLDFEEVEIDLDKIRDIRNTLINNNVKIINKENLKILTKIGTGTTGIVYGATFGNIPVAVKTIKLENLDDKTDMETNINSTVSELVILSRLEHPNILKLIGITIGSKYEDFSLITPFMNKGNLTNVLYGKNKINFTIKEKIDICTNISKGIQYLHSLSPKVLHRDLKPENILFNSKNEVKITDFGISKFMENTIQHMTLAGTPSYMSPEVFEDEKGKYTTKADVFGFGVVCIELFNGVRNNFGKATFKIIASHMSGTFDYKIEKSINLDLKIKEILHSCVKKDPNERYEMDYIVDILENYNY